MHRDTSFILKIESATYHQSALNELVRMRIISALFFGLLLATGVRAQDDDEEAEDEEDDSVGTVIGIDLGCVRRDKRSPAQRDLRYLSFSKAHPPPSTPTNPLARSYDESDVERRRQGRCCGRV